MNLPLWLFRVHCGPSIGLALVCLLAPLLPGGAGAATLTLAQCLERGLAGNPEVKSQQFAVKEAEEGIRAAWGDFLPTLTLSYGHTQINNSDSNERDADFLDQHSDNYSIRFSQPLFSGFSGVAGVKRARQARSYREYELLLARQRLVREIRSGYYDSLLARQLVAKWEESVRRLEQQRRIAQAWVDVELEPRIRLLEVDVELAEARQQRIGAEAALAKATARLEELLALPPHEPIEIVGKLEDTPPEPCASTDTCLTQALQRRPELGMARLNIEMAHQEARTLMARNLPQAELNASWTDYQRDYTAQDRRDEERSYASVMLNLSISPFQGGRTLFAWRQQRIAIERLQSQQDKLRQEITAEVKVQLAQLQESRSRVEVARDGLTQAREAYLVASRSAEVGIVSLKDLLTAELLLTRAEINRSNADHAVQKSLLLLDYVVGNDELPP